MDTVSTDIGVEAEAELAQPLRPPPSGRKLFWRTALMVLILLVLGGGLYGFDKFRQGMIAKYFAGMAPPPSTVSTVVATAEPLPHSAEGIGTITAVHQVTVAPEVGGRVTAVLFESGAGVKAGTPLIQLNDAPDRADLAAGHAQEVYAQRALERSQALAGKNFGTQQSVEQSQSQLDGARATIAHAEAMIAERLIRAPFTGQLGVRQVDVGQYLAAGTAIVTLTDLDQLYVNFTLPEQALATLAPGQKVEFTVDAIPNTTLVATLSTIEPQIDSTTRNIKVQASVPNPGHRLLPGMFAKVRVVLPPQPAVVTLPETAVDYTAYGETVYVIEETPAGAAGGHPAGLKAVQSFVKTGPRHDGKISILEGVSVGQRVVSAGQVKLHNGAAVVLGQEALVKPATMPVN